MLKKSVQQGLSSSANLRLTFHASRFTVPVSKARTKLADFLSILLASIAQFEHQYRACQKQRDDIGQNDRPGVEDQPIQKPETDAG